MSHRTEKNVGVIGLGIIGQRVADSLRRRGFQVFVWNRTPRPFPNFVGSPAEIAELCDYVQIFVSDDAALLEMAQQLKPSLKAHHVIMAHSTVAPNTMRAAAEIVQRRGAQFLDAPFTGSRVGAEKGELVYYVAGDDAALSRARPVLAATSKEIVEIGEIGQATLIKIATNMVTAATVQAGAEALALVHSAGVAPEKLVAAMRGNGSNSATLATKLPKMVEGDFDPHFSVRHMLKDVQIASRLARSYGLVFGATEAAHASLFAEAQRGGDDLDFSALSRMYFPDRPPALAARSEGQEQADLVLEEPAPEEMAVAESETEIRETEVRGEENASDEGALNAAPEPVATGGGAAPVEEGERDRRGFLRRMFGKGMDY